MVVRPCLLAVNREIAACLSHVKARNMQQSDIARDQNGSRVISYQGGDCGNTNSNYATERLTGGTDGGDEEVEDKIGPLCKAVCKAEEYDTTYTANWHARAVRVRRG